jgi:hypothetical protein
MMKLSSRDFEKDSPAFLVVSQHVRERRLVFLFWAVALLLGAVQAWTGRNAMNEDGISYLDIGDAFVRGDWSRALNSYWGPLYSWFLGLALFILKPSPDWEFAVVHLVNFAVFVGALWCFHFFLSELVDRRRAFEASKHVVSNLPPWAFLALGYALFIWFSLEWISIRSVTPDMGVSAVVYLASGLILRMQRQRENLGNFILLGVVLGCGYWTKYPMFPMAFVFLAISVFSIGSARKGLRRALVALVVFLAIGSPLFVTFSHRAGHITFADSARLNYAWNVNGIPAYAHWQGGPPGDGSAVHPTRESLEGLSVYEFEKPNWGTYSLWYNPVYWHQGLHVHFHLRKQLAKLFATTKIYFNIFFRLQGALIAGFLILFMMNGRGWGCLTNILQQWRLLIISLVALGMYSLVRVDLRFVAPFLILLWTGLASAVEFRANSDESRKAVSCVTAAMLIVVMITTFANTVSVALGDVSGEPNSTNSLALVQCRVADELRREGIRPGDEVAFIGASFSAYWARLARVRIVAEIVPEDADKFWAADPTAKERIINAFRGTKARIIVTDHIPPFSSAGEWRQVLDTDYYVFPLRQRSLSARRQNRDLSQGL